MALLLLFRLIVPAPVPVKAETLLLLAVASAAVPPLRLIVNPLEAVSAALAVCDITVPLAVEAVSVAAPLAVIASLKAIVVPERDSVPTLVEVVPVVIAPAFVTDKFSELPPKVFN